MFLKNRASEWENFVWDSVELKEFALSFCILQAKMNNTHKRMLKDGD